MPVHATIQRRLSDIAEICRARHVLQLDLFGSGTSDSFNEVASDFDFLVRFEDLSPVEHADAYFGLLEDLQRVLGRSIDLLERGPIRNPYFLREIESTRIGVYAA